MGADPDPKYEIEAPGVLYDSSSSLSVMHGLLLTVFHSQCLEATVWTREKVVETADEATGNDSQEKAATNDWYQDNRGTSVLHMVIWVDNISQFSWSPDLTVPLNTFYRKRSSQESRKLVQVAIAGTMHSLNECPTVEELERRAEEETDTYAATRWKAMAKTLTRRR